VTRAPETATDLGGLLAELEWRGILQETTPGLPARLATGRPISGYIGFDPTADSLHVGHLVPIFGLIRLQRFGGKPVALVGGGTGMIGDPSGRSSERNLLDADTLAANVAAIRGQLGRFLDFDPGSNGAILVNNLDWLGRLSLVDFLRDTGKHFTIPYMLDKDSVQVRLSRGLSFTEFSYMLLQAYDFATA
jgi:tyrosyl-tRNA synthetase